MRIIFLGNNTHVNTKSWIEEMERQEVEVFPWSFSFHKDKSKSKLSILNDFFELRKWIKEIKPDLIIAYRPTSYGFLAYMLGKKPYIVASQGEKIAWPPGQWAYPVKRWMATRAIRGASLIQAWSESMAKDIRLSLNGRKKKILVKPRGIFLDRFPFDLKPLEKNEIKGIVTRSLHPEYCIEVVIKAVKILVENGLNFHLNIAGDGPQRSELESISKELCIEEHINFLGRIPNQQLKSYFKKSHFYLSMPVTEGASASLFEAFASGLFPIVSDLPGNKVWIQQGVNGYLIPIGDHEKLANRIIEVTNDRVSYKDAIYKNRDFAKMHFSIEKNVADFIHAYKEIL